MTFLTRFGFLLGLAGIAAAQEENPRDLLHKWVEEGSAVGFSKIRYDNRDQGHSQLGLRHYPDLVQVTRQPGEPNTGPPARVHLLPVVGNCSMAAPADKGGSIGRRLLSEGKQAPKYLYAQYRAGNIYVYPEHRDHDPGVNGSPGYGDLFPTNSPCLLVSQGSSGSDRVLVSAVARTMASFSPEVFGSLRTHKLLAPTVQQLLRTHYQPTLDGGAEGYFSRKAHPTVFEGKLINELAMMKAAHSMTLDTVPPLVHLAVTSEDKALRGRDYFEAEDRGEALSDTPACIARVFRTSKPYRTMKVSAGQSLGLKAGRLNYRWVLLRGDPKQVRITPSEDGSSAEIVIAHHSRAPIEEGSALVSNRIDIGVFASNGKVWSAPAFVTSFSLANEDRVYGQDGKLQEIFYGGQARELAYPRTSQPLAYVRLLEHFQRDVDQVFSPRLRAGVESAEVASLADLREKLLPKAQLVEAEREEIVANEKMWVRRIQTSVLSVREAPEAQQEALMAEHRELVEMNRKVALEREERFQNTEILLKEMTPVLEAPLASGRRPAEVLRASIEKMLSDPALYFDKAPLIDSLARTRKGNQFLPLVRQLEELAVIGRTADGGFSVKGGNGRIAANDMHHLRRLNLELLGNVAFPEFFDYTSAPNFVDPALSAPRVWRDVYQYDENGAVKGWSRIAAGVGVFMTPDGKAMVKGAGGRSVPAAVRYVRGQDGFLRMEPISGSQR